jgi:ABC-type transporter Mla subunit MlaD
MGFDEGEITRIELNEPGAYFNITVDFRIRKPYYGYIWTDSKVRVAAANFLGNRYLEITEGEGGVPTVYETDEKTASGILVQHVYERRRTALLPQYTNDPQGLLQALNAEARQNPGLYYTNLTGRPFWLDPIESPAITERLEQLVSQVEDALPAILSLTNQLSTVLSNSAILTSNLNDVASSARPAISNIAMATSRLGEPGALGEWLLPTNISVRLDSVLGTADVTLSTANTNIAILASNLNLSLENLANITSNLNAQVESNTNILSQVSKVVVDANELVEGLKRHWLLRSAFRNESGTRERVRRPPETLRAPRDE